MALSAVARRGSDVTSTDATEIVKPSEQDLAQVRRWISRTRDLPLIAAGMDLDLRRGILDAWVGNGRLARVMRYRGDTLAFATLCETDAELPGGSVEICHCIVLPQVRRRYLGSQLILSLMSEAKQLGYDRVVGRVEPANAIAKDFLTSLRWTTIPKTEPWATPDFVWYRRQLSA